MALIFDSLYVGVRVRATGDSTWMDLNCEVDSTEHVSITSNTQKTKCGPFSGFTTPDTEYSGNAVYDIDSGDGAASYGTILAWILANTGVDFLYYNKAFTDANGTPVAEGAIIHHFSTGQFIDISLQSPVGEATKFSWQFKPGQAIVTSGSST